MDEIYVVVGVLSWLIKPLAAPRASVVVSRPKALWSISVGEVMNKAFNPSA